MLTGEPGAGRRRGPPAFFVPPPQPPTSPPLLSFPSRQPQGWGRPLAAGGLPCGPSLRARGRRLTVSSAGDPVTARAAAGAARGAAGVPALGGGRLRLPLVGSSVPRCALVGRAHRAPRCPFRARQLREEREPGDPQVQRLQVRRPAGRARRGEGGGPVRGGKRPGPGARLAAPCCRLSGRTWAELWAVHSARFGPNTG